MGERYLDPTDEAAVRLFSSGIEGEVLMLNLLRFRAVADYSGFSNLRPEHDISGREAYQKYIEHTLPHLESSGGSLELLAEGGHYFIGPADELWDLVMVVRQRSLQDFLQFAGNEAYQRGVGHRTAALSDSRLPPIVEIRGRDITGG